MKENLKQTSISKITKIITTTAVGAGLIFGGRAIVNDLRTINAENCTPTGSCLSTPPEMGEPDIMVRSFNDDYVKMDETLKWIPEIKRWQIIDRQWEPVAREKSSNPLSNELDKLYTIDNLARREEFFKQPENPDCKTGNWNNDNWSYTYCWDKNTDSWQETGEGPLYNQYR